MKLWTKIDKIAIKENSDDLSIDGKLQNSKIGIE